MTLEADFAALLSELAGSSVPLDRIDDWFDAHEQEAFGYGTASYELRTCVQDALAVCWRFRRSYLGDAAARSRLRALADRLLSVL
jgi:hypothetical protein